MDFKGLMKQLLESGERGRQPSTGTSPASSSSKKPSQKTNDNPYSQPLVEGLSQYYPDPSDRDATFKAAVDIIAIHGLATHAPRTWMAFINGKDDTDGSINWLSDQTMLPSVIPDAQILSYNWSAYYQGEELTRKRFISEADNLLTRLHDDRTKKERLQRPIIFVCSCFGGLLLAKALARAYEPAHPGVERVRPIADHTVGVVFLGTPFRGSWEFGYANTQAQIELAKQNNTMFSQELCQYLRPDSRNDANGNPSPLDEVVQKFTELVHHRHFGCPVICFFETKPAMYGALTRNLPPNLKPKNFDNKAGFAITVPESSAALDGFERIALGVRHNLLSKHNSPESDGYVCISSRIRELADNAQTTLYNKAKRQETASLTMPMQIAEYLEAEMYSAKQQTILAKRTPETCLALTQSAIFGDWRDGSRPSILICQGEPGAGKTIFSSVVIDSLQKRVRAKQEDALAYIYLGYANLDQNGGIVTLLRSILKQLLAIVPFAPEAVSLLYRQLKTEGRQPNETEAEEAIHQGITTFPGRAYLVLDALDECTDAVSMQLMKVLSRLHNKADLSILVTSRINNNIANAFSGALVRYLPVSGAKADIERFLQANIGRTSNFLKWSASRQVVDEIVQRISGSSEGMFEIARLQLASLADTCSNDEVISALDEFRRPERLFWDPSPIRGASSERVAQLYDLAYMKTVQRINTMPGARPDIARNALAWLLYSPGMLSPDELLHALAITTTKDTYGPYKPVLRDTYDLQSVVRLCAGLLTVEGASVRLAHYTAKEFLATKLWQVTRPNQMEAQGAQQDRRNLALSCLAYLSLDAFNTGYYDDPVALASRLQQYPFHKHAASHLGYYARSVIFVEEDPQLRDICFSFFGSDQKIRAASQFTETDIYLPNIFKINLSVSKGPLGLYYATCHGLTEIAKFLLNRRESLFSYAPTPEALLKATDAAGYTPLCLAAYLHHSKLIELFLQYDAADLAHVSRDGPPLVLAAYGGYPQTMRLLLKHTRHGEVDAMYIAVHNNDEDHVQLLLKAGVNPYTELEYPNAVMRHVVVRKRDTRGLSPPRGPWPPGYSRLDRHEEERQREPITPMALAERYNQKIYRSISASWRRYT